MRGVLIVGTAWAMLGLVGLAPTAAAAKRATLAKAPGSLSVVGSPRKAASASGERYPLIRPKKPVELDVRGPTRLTVTVFRLYGKAANTRGAGALVVRRGKATLARLALESADPTSEDPWMMKGARGKRVAPGVSTTIELGTGRHRLRLAAEGAVSAGLALVFRTEPVGSGIAAPAAVEGPGLVPARDIFPDRLLRPDGSVDERATWYFLLPQEDLVLTGRGPLDSTVFFRMIVPPQDGASLAAGALDVGLALFVDEVLVDQLRMPMGTDFAVRTPDGSGFVSGELRVSLHLAEGRHDVRLVMADSAVAGGLVRYAIEQGTSPTGRPDGSSLVAGAAGPDSTADTESDADTDSGPSGLARASNGTGGTGPAGAGASSPGAGRRRARAAGAAAAADRADKPGLAWSLAAMGSATHLAELRTWHVGAGVDFGATFGQAWPIGVELRGRFGTAGARLSAPFGSDRTIVRTLRLTLIDALAVATVERALGPFVVQLAVGGGARAARTDLERADADVRWSPLGEAALVLGFVLGPGRVVVRGGYLLGRLDGGALRGVDGSGPLMECGYALRW